MTQSLLHGDLAQRHAHAAVRWKLCPPLSKFGFMRNRWLLQSCANKRDFAFWSQGSTLWRPSWEWCKLWNTNLRYSAVFTRTRRLIKFTFLIWKSRLNTEWLLLKHHLSLKSPGFRKRNGTLNLSYWSIRLMRQRISNIEKTLSFLWWRWGLIFHDLSQWKGDETEKDVNVFSFFFLASCLCD